MGEKRLRKKKEHSNLNTMELVNKEFIRVNQEIFDNALIPADKHDEGVLDVSGKIRTSKGSSSIGIDI